MAETFSTKDIYKVYQLMEFFTNKHSFNNVYSKDFSGSNEVWLINKDNPLYNIIRISHSTLDETFMMKNRIDNFINILSKSYKFEAKFLDIHINYEKPNDNEIYTTICINTNYYSGIDIDNAFPLIKNVIHDVDNAENELSNRIASINNGLKQRLELNKTKFKSKLNINATKIIILLCIVFFILSTLLQLNDYEFASTYIALGACYKTFTLGLHQYFRFFTYAFLHSSILHLGLNMYSLFILGNLIERRYGTLKYLIILFVSIIVGGMSHSVLSSGELLMGMSGGIYGLFAIYIIEAIKQGAYRNSSFVILIMINVALNFTSNVAWQTHLGGAIAGCLLYYLFIDDKKIDYKILVLILIMFLGLSYKCITTENKGNLYIGTDNEVLKIYNDLGLKKYSLNLSDRLYNYYMNR